MTFNNIKRSILLLSLLSFVLGIQAQAPNGYYNNAKGRSGAGLKTALFGIISDHVARSYDNLWTDFKSTDLREDGKIWDMYSNISNFTPGKDQHGKGGNNGVEGGCYNREHSFPKSWFDQGKPMYTDLFHLYPTDAKINSMRSNFPFGETDHPKNTSKNGFSKLGPSSTPGYNGTVFEPADEYKGDFARTYFYMATAYENRFSSFRSPMLAGNAYPGYAKWAIDMLLRWAQEDPVSEKEIKRNNAVYKIQHNRNPYIDYPGLEQYVWGSKTSTAFDPDNYEGGGSVDPQPEHKDVVAPSFSPEGGVVAEGTEVNITTPTQGAYIYYKVNNGDEFAGYSPVKISIHENTSITAYAMLGEHKSETVTATYTIPGNTPVGENVYTLVTNASQLAVGQYVLIAAPTKDVALSALKDDVRGYASVSISADQSIRTSVNGTNEPYALLLGEEAGNWTFLDQVKNQYLSLNSDGNKLHVADKATTSNAQWTISFGSDDIATISNVKYSNRAIKYNSGAPRFACYKSGQAPVSIYGLMTKTAIAEIEHQGQGVVKVYNLNGTLLRTGSTVRTALENLQPGFYIVNGVKLLVR